MDSDIKINIEKSTKRGQYIYVSVLFWRGLLPPDAEMLYMQEVERMEGYGEESYPAKVLLKFSYMNLLKIFQWSQIYLYSLICLAYRILHFSISSFRR